METARERPLSLGLVTPGVSADEDDPCIPVLRDLVRRLSAEHDVRVLALRYPWPRCRYRLFGAEVESLGAGGGRGAGRLAMAVRALATIRRWHRERPFDVIHAQWGHEPGALTTLAGRLLRVPAVVYLFGGELADLPEIGYGAQGERLNRHLVAFSLRRADRVLVGSRFLAERARERVPGGRLVRLPLGVDLERFRPDGPSVELAGHPALLCAASLVPVKGHADLVAGLPRVAAAHPRVQLHLVGDGPLAGDLRERAAAVGVADHLHLHGEVDHGELAALYRGADLCVLASRWEGLGMVVLEAAACGRATAGTRVGVLPELAPPAATAPPGDPAALAGAILAALDGGWPRRPWVSRRRLAEEYGLDASLARLEALYRGLARRPRRRSGRREEA